MKAWYSIIILCVASFSSFGLFSDEAPKKQSVVVASKVFTESVILGEILKLSFEAVGVPTEHKKQLGGTQIVWGALLNGDIDAYVDYSGTLAYEMFRGKTPEEIDSELKALGIGRSGNLGFNNTYALGMPRQRAEALNIKTISDLRAHPDLVFGFTEEFIARSDGWPRLRQVYQLPQADVKEMMHDLAYKGIAAGALDLTVLYSTDAEIAYYDLVALKDDQNYFPRYDAFVLYRLDTVEQLPQLSNAIHQLAGVIPEAKMITMNKAVKIDKVPDSQVAAKFINEQFSKAITVEEKTWWQELIKRTREHLFLVSISLFAAILCAVPLGIIALKYSASTSLILNVVGILQTIPSFALLVFMIPLFGIGPQPAIVALFLYSLLPIVRNTYTGLKNIPAHLQESAQALGLPAKERLIKVELPLAMPTILAGIKTSAVINVGTATLGAIIGAGGYGQPILTGIRLDDMNTILQGAIPAALLAVVVQWLFNVGERTLPGFRSAA